MSDANLKFAAGEQLLAEAYFLCLVLQKVSDNSYRFHSLHSDRSTPSAVHRLWTVTAAERFVFSIPRIGLHPVLPTAT